MAKPRKKDKDVQKWKKKRWYQITATKAYNNAFLGETTVLESSKIIGKTMKVNLMNLTGDMKNQNVNVKFTVRSINESKAEAELTGYTLSPSFIKRIVRRRHSRVDSKFDLITKDSKKVVIKPMIITRNIVNRSESTALRSAALESLKKLASDQNYDDFVKSMIHYKLQLEMRKQLKKIYPLKTFEVKDMHLLEEEDANASA